MHIELALNLVWLLLAATALVCWSLAQPCARSRSGLRLVVLGALLSILFPAISITDDLWTAHNQAETDVLRFDDSRPSHAVLLHPAPANPLSSFEFSIALSFEAITPLPDPFPRENTLRSCLFIRPPPVL